MRARFASLLFLSTISLSACQGLPVMTAADGSSQPGTNPLAALTPPATAKTFAKTAVLFRNAEYSVFEVYESSAIDVLSGEENNTPDFGHMQFSSLSGAGKYNDGFFVTVRKAQANAGIVNLGAIDKGAIGSEAITEAPEGGYSSATVGKRNRLGITAGNVYLLRFKTRVTQRAPRRAQRAGLPQWA